MKTQTLIYILEIALLSGVIAALIITLWNSVPVPTLLATVSWNG